VLRHKSVLRSPHLELRWSGIIWSPSTQSGAVPAVVIAHGLGGLQSSRLQPYAERFANAGYHAITFDYRYWGESDGQPRNIVDVPSQQDDYKAAISAVKTMPGVDGDRIVIWGTSLSGGHVLELGAKLPELAAVIAQAPHVNGPATASQLPPASLPGLVAQGTTDAAGAALGQPPLTSPWQTRPARMGLLPKQALTRAVNSFSPTRHPQAMSFLLVLCCSYPSSYPIHMRLTATTRHILAWD